MALRNGSRFGVSMQDVFSHGCHLVPGSLSEAQDYDEKTKRRTPAVDKVTGKIRTGDWINPDLGKVTLAEYAHAWVDERPELRPKTVELYRYLPRKHLTPVLGPMLIADVQLGHVRRWRNDLADRGVSAVTMAKAYRLLKAIMTTAVDDDAVRRHPCRIKGGGAEQSAERVLRISALFPDKRATAAERRCRG